MKQLLHETRENLRKSLIHGATENLDEHCVYGKKEIKEDCSEMKTITLSLKMKWRQ